jgi:hypothetical protein
LLCDGLDGGGSVYGLFEAHAIISSAKANLSLVIGAHMRLLHPVEHLRYRWDLGEGLGAQANIEPSLVVNR